MTKRIATILAGLIVLFCFVGADFSLLPKASVSATETFTSFGLVNGNFNTISPFGFLSGWGGVDNGVSVFSVPSGIKENYSEDDYCLKVTDNTKNIIYSANPEDGGYGDGCLRLTTSVGYRAGVAVYPTAGSSAKITVQIAESEVDAAKVYAETTYTLSSEQSKTWIECSTEYDSADNERAKLVIVVEAVSGTVYLDDAFFNMDNPLSIESGAYFKVTTETAALRFFGRINKAYVDKINANVSGDGVEYGILITTEDILNDASDFTVDGLGDEDKYTLMQANTIYNEETAEADGYYGFACSLVNIKPTNLNRRFAVRTYLRYSILGDVFYEYSDFSAEDNERSFSEVINKAAELRDYLDDNTKDVVEYHQNNIG